MVLRRREGGGTADTKWGKMRNASNTPIPGLTDPEGQDRVEAAESAVLGANPFVSLTPEQMVRALGRWAAALGRHPTVLVAEMLVWGSDELRVLAGASPVAPDPKDRRFADPAWTGPVWRRVAQSYLASRAGLLRSVDELGLDVKSAERARFALMQFTELGR
jgi:polyhydroxyalkanoate synthase